MVQPPLNISQFNELINLFFTSHSKPLEEPLNHMAAEESATPRVIQSVNFATTANLTTPWTIQYPKEFINLLLTKSQRSGRSSSQEANDVATEGQTSLKDPRDLTIARKGKTRGEAARIVVPDSLTAIFSRHFSTSSADPPRGRSHNSCRVFSPSGACVSRSSSSLSSHPSFASQGITLTASD